MPFGCLAVRDGQIYNSLSDITDKYDFGQVLKAKEFCELCLVKERETDKVYVCKKFLKKDGKKVRRAAKNEIMILKMIKHPNILQLIDTFETRKEYFIIQELATGGDVFDWILDQGNYTERDASNVIRQVLKAVAYLHSINIVHRNLKLENLMYYTENNHNKVVLRDFYLSKFENGAITEPCGTPEYLAPEVVARHRYGRPVDCWAVGVIMYMLLSGNPPFYDETEEENTDIHNRIIFRRILSGEFEFDSPYWDDISPAAKELVCRLMEVDQMLRITAQDALWHEWIAGNGASEKNLKDGVCAQFEKNFAKAKWRKAIRVTTFMQRLRAPELAGGAGEAGPKNEGQVTAKEDGNVGVTNTKYTNLEVTAGKKSMEVKAEEKGKGEVTTAGEANRSNGAVQASFLVGVAPASSAEALNKARTSPKPAGHHQDREGVSMSKSDSTTKNAALWGQSRSTPEKKAMLLDPDAAKLAESRGTKVIVLEQEDGSSEEKKLPFPEMASRRKMAAVLSRSPDDGGRSVMPTAAPPAGQDKAVRHEGLKGERGQDVGPGSWCQTQLPEAVAEKTAESPKGRDKTMEGVEKSSSDFSISKVKQAGVDFGQTECPGLSGKTSVKEEREVGGGLSGYVSPYCPPYSSSGGVVFSGFGAEGSRSSDWMMDSVIEQIERQMAAVLEKIEGDMPSLLEQISDCPEQKAKSAHCSPSPRHRALPQATPPPLPTSPRPPLPSLPHLNIQPPSYRPPPPPVFPVRSPLAAPELGERNMQRAEGRSAQSPRGGQAARGL
ncbi:caM kinase-like vesicle-associated, like [Paramormyrops kingsleyae]|uniref:CaM kinase-like vesicle-associated protein n=1 Tax=Paramormyrops kingsleyae TaxID=1676925 RepID=A0A3B3S295_9TELE|nr:caM kinase-like vesicle-associated protein isoform X2 [Paramormyrops kingsleyae]